MIPPAPNVVTTAAAWNARYPVGTRVTVMLDDGTVLRTRTRRVAWTLGDGTAVVSVEGIVGGYDLARVCPAE